MTNGRRALSYWTNNNRILIRVRRITNRNVFAHVFGVYDSVKKELHGSELNARTRLYSI